MSVQTFRDGAHHQRSVRSADDGHRPENTGHTLRFWHFYKLLSILFIVVTSATQSSKLFQLSTWNFRCPFNLYTLVEIATEKMKFLAEEHNTMTQPP